MCQMRGYKRVKVSACRSAAWTPARGAAGWCAVREGRGQRAGPSKRACLGRG